MFAMKVISVFNIKTRSGRKNIERFFTNVKKAFMWADKKREGAEFDNGPS